MRKLEEHFCTYKQAESIIDLGYEQNFIVLRESLDEAAPTHAGVLRSQALDFFRDKGWQFAIKCLDKMYWYEIYIGDSISFDENITEDGLYDYHVSESALIDKLIELEMEVQNR